VPDIVGVLRVDQAWGSAQLSGAYHRISTVGATINNLNLNNTLTGFVVNPIVGTVAGGYGAVTGNGWAIQGGVKLNVPYVAAGDYAYLEAAYSKGAGSYTNGGGFPGAASAGAISSSFDNLFQYDGVVGPGGNLRLTPQWTVLGTYTHYWTPTIRQSIG